MGNELIGKIYFAVDDENWYSDTSEPVLHGYYLLDYVSTNRWPLIVSNPNACKAFIMDENHRGVANNRNQQLMELVEKLIDSELKESQVDEFCLPASFDPHHCYLIDILLYLGIKLNFIGKIDALKLSNEWAGYNETDGLLLENETQTINKINNVIDYLIENKLRVGAVSQDVMLNYPPKFSEEDFPNIGKLKFICYSPSLHHE